MKKRLLVLVVASILILSILPAIALAAGAEMDGAAFLASANESGVISLAGDTTVTSSVAITTGAYTVKLNGHTLSGNGNFVLFSLSGDASLTVTGPGTVSGGKYVFQTAGSASLTLQGTEDESLTVYGDTATKSTIWATGSGNVTVRYADVYGVDGGSSSAASALYWASSGTLLVENSSVHGGDTVGSYAEGGAALEIRGANVTLRETVNSMAATASTIMPVTPLRQASCRT